MKFEDQVCSLDLAKRLKEFGVKQESYFFHDVKRHLIVTSGYKGSHPSLEFVSAFTVAELGEMLSRTAKTTQYITQNAGDATYDEWIVLDIDKVKRDGDS